VVPLSRARLQGMCTSFLTQLEPASAELLHLELCRIPGFRDASKVQGKDVRHPGGRAVSASEFVLVEGFWLHKVQCLQELREVVASIVLRSA
jgi:hypothetical protein